MKTAQSSSRDYGEGPDLFLVEIIRVKKASKNQWQKSSVPISFPVAKLKLPNFSRSYTITASCHHRGSLTSGHWFTKLSTNHGWYELDDLKKKNFVPPPGNRDNSVVVLLLIAEDRLNLKA
jgi:ubiquitin C-terminal hydrolase